MLRNLDGHIERGAAGEFAAARERDYDLLQSIICHSEVPRVAV